MACRREGFATAVYREEVGINGWFLTIPKRGGLGKPSEFARPVPPMIIVLFICAKVFSFNVPWYMWIVAGMDSVATTSLGRGK